MKLCLVVLSVIHEKGTGTYFYMPDLIYVDYVDNITV